MHIQSYDYITGRDIGRIETIDFGNIAQGQHCVKPTVLRLLPDTETSVSDIKLYLENKGTWKDSEFGYHTAHFFEPNIESGSTKMSLHMTEVPEATSSSPNSVPIGYNTTASDYIWIDVKIPLQTGSTEANYRVFFNYS